MLPLNNISVAPVCEGTANANYALVDDTKESNELAEMICDADTVVELKKGYSSSAYTALASLGGNTVGVVSVKGRIGSKAAEKIASFVRFCD